MKGAILKRDTLKKGDILKDWGGGHSEGRHSEFCNN